MCPKKNHGQPIYQALLKELVDLLIQTFFGDLLWTFWIYLRFLGVQGDIRYLETLCQVIREGTVKKKCQVGLDTLDHIEFFLKEGRGRRMKERRGERGPRGTKGAKGAMGRKGTMRAKGMTRAKGVKGTTRVVRISYLISLYPLLFKNIAYVEFLPQFCLCLCLCLGHCLCHCLCHRKRHI